MTAVDGTRIQPFTLILPPVRDIDLTVLWAGAIATAFVAGLLSIVGILVAHVLPGMEIIAPGSGTRYAEATAWRLMSSAVTASLGAALLLHLLLVLTPRPFLFFRCIAVLMTAVLALWPFTTTAPVPSKIATAIIHLAVGTFVTALTSSVGHHAYRELVTAGAARVLALRPPGAARCSACGRCS